MQFYLSDVSEYVRMAASGVCTGQLAGTKENVRLEALRVMVHHKHDGGVQGSRLNIKLNFAENGRLRTVHPVTIITKGKRDGRLGKEIGANIRLATVISG